MKAKFLTEIPCRSSECVYCGTPLKSEMTYLSAIFEDEEENLTRKDYCFGCWKQQKPKASTYWKAKVPPKKKKEISHDREKKALELLKAIVATGDDKSQEEAFILSLFLVRKRWLTLRKEMIQDDQILCLYEVPSTEEIIPVRKVDLSQLEIDAVQEKIAEKLQIEQVLSH